jgi:hypothetical protein
MHLSRIDIDAIPRVAKHTVQTRQTPKTRLSSNSLKPAENNIKNIRRTNMP